MRAAQLLALFLLPWPTIAWASEQLLHGAVGVGLLGVDPLPAAPVGIAAAFERDLMRVPAVPTPGFAVAAELPLALNLSHMGIRKNESPYGEGGVLHAGAPVYVAFFSSACAYQIELLSASRADAEIAIRYRFVPDYAPRVHRGFALLPLGVLPAGKYEVAIEQQPMEQKHLRAGFQPVSSREAACLVSSSFEFVVENPPSPRPAPADGARVIPASKFVGNGPHGLRGLEPDVFVLQSSPDRIVELSTPESLEAIRDRAKASMVYQIENSIGRYIPEAKDPIPTAFAVAGVDQKALAGVHRVIVRHQRPVDEYTADAPVSLVFIQSANGLVVRLHSAEIGPESIRVFYSISAGHTTEGHARVVLIPCGTLAPGTYDVLPERISDPNAKESDSSVAPRLGGPQANVFRTFRL